METIKYELREYFENGNYQVRMSANNWHDLRNAAFNIQDENPCEYKIHQISVTDTCIDIFTIPAYSPTLDEIIESIINSIVGNREYSYGVYYNKLSKEDQEKVINAVEAATDCCDMCANFVMAGDLYEHYFEGSVCDSCFAELEDWEDEEESEDEDEEEDED
jgi:hypothetical protein